MPNSMTLSTSPSRGRQPVVRFPKPSGRSHLRLFCFAYAGGSVNAYYRWAEVLAPSAELGLVNLPGREDRIAERSAGEMGDLVRVLGRAMLPYLDKPMAFFGHSMGALLAFELARQLRREYGAEPEQLFVSGCRPPQEVGTDVHDDGLAPTPGELPDSPRSGGGSWCDGELARLLLPPLLADLAVWRAYRYASEPPLCCGITGYGGQEDQGVPRECLQGWKDETASGFVSNLFPGGHFFIHTAESLVLKVLAGQLRELAARV